MTPGPCRGWRRPPRGRLAGSVAWGLASGAGCGAAKLRIEGGGCGRLRTLRPWRAGEAGFAWGARPACATTDRAPTASCPGPPPDWARAQAPAHRIRPGPALGRQPRGAFRCPLPVTATAESVRRFSSNGRGVSRSVGAAAKLLRAAWPIGHPEKGQEGSWRSYFERVRLFTIVCIAGHATGLPESGWRHRRAHSVMSYS